MPEKIHICTCARQRQCCKADPAGLKIDRIEAIRGNSRDIVAMLITCTTRIDGGAREVPTILSLAQQLNSNCEQVAKKETSDA